MRAGLSMRDVRWVDLPSALDAGLALREGRADAIVGLRGDVEAGHRGPGRDELLATTADAPHLVATVLVVRGEFAARYPDGVRRIIRGLLDAAAVTLKDPVPAARLLGEVAPSLGDPREAVHGEPPATLQENLAFFGTAGRAAGHLRRAVPERARSARQGRIAESPPLAGCGGHPRRHRPPEARGGRSVSEPSPADSLARGAARARQPGGLSAPRSARRWSPDTRFPLWWRWSPEAVYLVAVGLVPSLRRAVGSRRPGAAEDDERSVCSRSWPKPAGALLRSPRPPRLDSRANYRKLPGGGCWPPRARPQSRRSSPPSCVSSPR